MTRCLEKSLDGEGTEGGTKLPLKGVLVEDFEISN